MDDQYRQKRETDRMRNRKKNIQTTKWNKNRAHRNRYSSLDWCVFSIVIIIITFSLLLYHSHIACEFNSVRSFSLASFLLFLLLALSVAKREKSSFKIKSFKWKTNQQKYQCEAKEEKKNNENCINKRLFSIYKNVHTLIHDISCGIMKSIQMQTIFTWIVNAIDDDDNDNNDDDDFDKMYAKVKWMGIGVLPCVQSYTVTNQRMSARNK